MTERWGITPTSRCAVLVGAAALTALALPLWVSLVALGLVLVAAAIDGLAVREAPRLQRHLAPTVSRGVSADLAVVASVADSRRVLLRQPATAALAVTTRAGRSDLRGSLTALARGRQQLPGVASASVGPLGLARWHHRDGVAAELLVYPNLVRGQELAMRLRQGRAAVDGRLRRGPLGLGTDFESVREYSPDDDIRQLNWPATARLGRPMSNQYRVEQENDVTCLLDCGRLMAAQQGDGTLLDAALDAVTAVALAADELGDRCGAIAFDADVRRALVPRRLGGRRVISALFDLQPQLVDSDFERAFLRVGDARRGLVLVLTDLLDQRAARSLVRAAAVLSRRHVLVVASVADPALDADLRAADSDPALALAAASVLAQRDAAAAAIARAGAAVALAPPALFAQRCVQAYVRAKERLRR